MPKTLQDAAPWRVQQLTSFARTDAFAQIGIAVCLTALNVFALVSSNPLAHRNDVVYAVQMDNWDPKEPWWDDHPELAPFELTYRDAKAVAASDIPDRTVIMRKTAMVLAPPDGVTSDTAKPFIAIVRSRISLKRVL